MKSTRLSVDLIESSISLRIDEEYLRRPVVHRPGESNAFEFVIVASLRAAQLMRGCVPRVSGAGKAVTIAQREVAEGKVTAAAAAAKIG